MTYTEGSISEDQADRVQSPSSTEEKEEKKESLMLKLYSQMRTSRKKTGTTSSLGTPGKTGGQPQGKLHFTEGTGLFVPLVLSMSLYVSMGSIGAINIYACFCCCI